MLLVEVTRKTDDNEERESHPYESSYRFFVR